jgi:hypothetical protein
MKILICVVCADHGEHPLLARGIKATWGFDQPDVYYLWAKDHKIIQRNDWVGNMEEGYGSMVPKFIDFMQQYLGEYDYVMKTNTGCYIDILALHAWLEDKPRTNLYAGWIGHYDDGSMTVDVDYVSGSGIIFSHDLIKLMLNNKRDLQPRHIDDVCYGVFMKIHGIQPTLGQRTSDLNESSYHYKLRSDDGTRMLDVMNMKLLHDRRTEL